MAERPLYTLYKNLKAQNYDVPNDYNKFESALTRDGKSGADNRHAIYENLKAQNFDVPDTYERFYTALFEPRSKTSSRAKGGSVPMSAADRARFLSGAAAISASAKQIANNDGRYNRLKQRKQKQQKDFGRVNLGTHLTPFGGDANNVVKDEFAYNPETGKAGAYVTSDNENAYTQSDAEQKQAILDKYGEEWNKAVDMGMVPSELDKADPGLSDTDVAMRQMERRQEWLDENQNRRSKELNESMHLQDSPFVASGGAVAPSSFNAAIGNEANRLSDAEYGAYNTAKAYNQMLRTTLLQELKEQKQRNENAGWWKDKWNDVSNYFGGMLDTMFDPKLYSQGVMDAAIASNLLQVKKGMEDGTIKKGSNAGNAAQVMLSAIQQQQGEAAKQQQYGTKAYQYGDVSGRSLKFMGDFALSGWRDVMTTGFTKAGEKVGEKMALGALGKWFTKNTGRVLGDMAGSAALAATNQLGSTYNNVIERYVGMNNENGGVTQDKDGDLSFNKGVSLGKAIKDGLGSATIENFSEMFGEYLPGASKILSKLGLSKVSSFFEKIGNNAYYKWLSNATNKSGIQGVMAEISEEEFGTALHAAWGDGDGSWSDFNVFTNPDAREKQIDTCLGMFYSVGFMQSPRTAVGAINAVKYFNIKHQVTKADKFGQMMFNDKWDEIKSKIDVTTNADLTKTVLDATRSDSLTAKQKGAVINYAMFLSKLRGFNQASDAKTKDKVEEGETAPTLSNDLDDAYTEGHNADDADKHDIQIQHEDQAKTLAAALSISEQQLSGMSDEELESLTGQDDKLDQAIYDYQLSTARYQGVVDDAQDKVDLAAHQAEQRVNMYTDQSRGSVRNATIKASGGAEDYGVYIISGNIATHEDGSIDVSNSDDMILYFDPTTNSVEHADALMFAELGEELPADEVKAQAVADAKENAIKEVAGIIDGTVEVGSQFSVTDADGTEHTYEVLADNGDGTAMITIDGNVPTELVKGENVQIPYSFEDLQKMKDLEDQKRLEAAKIEREQMEKERAGQQTQETEQTEDSQPSFDFNQILNDNGNVVLVDVLGKDGNTKYPGSKLFLIRDAGAKAKVVELKSDGTLVPHAVNKEDVATISTMTLDEYKQAMPTSSMIEDNSGEIEGDRGGIEVNDELPPVPDNVTINGDGTYSVDGAVQGGENTTAPSEQTEQTPAITLEDGTIVPMLEDGNPDFSKLSAAQTAELYDTQFDEDADGIVSGYVSEAKKALDKANNMTVKGKTFVEQKAAKAAKEKAIADAQAAYDSAIAIRDAYNERQLAKEENTPEGRKSLIEKARRKFTRLKNSEEWSERTGDLWNETVGKLLHRLYDATGIDVFDDTPNTVYEYVAENVGPYSLNYEGNDNSKGVQQETGLSRSDFAKLGWLAAEGKGMTIDAKVHRLWENRPSNLESADTQEIRNALIGLITSGQTAFQARDYILNQRIELAESALEEQLRQEEDAAEAQKSKEEEEKKKAELEKKAEEEKTNENRNTPELSHEQQKAMEEGEKLGFPAVDKEGEPINQNVIELANWAKEQGLEIDPTSKSNSYADLYVMCKDGFGVSTLVPDVGEDINQVFYFPDNVQGEQLLKLQEEFNVGRDFKHSADMNSELTEGAMFYDGDTAREFKEFVDKKVEKQNKVFGEQRPEEDLPFSAKDNGQQQTTSERAADVEKNKVDDMKVVDNIVGQKTRKAFDRLAKMMGANIQWQYSDKLGNGWIQETTDADGNVHRTIFITLDSSITEGAQFIFGHEMTHQIKNLNPAAYNELTQLVLDTYGSDAFDKAVDETKKRYSDAGFSGRDRDYYAEEVVADAVGEMIRDLNLAHTLAMKMSHPLLAAIHEILQKIKLAFYGTEYSDVTKNIIRSIEQAYVMTAKGRVENSETGEDVSFSLRQKPEPKKKGVGYKVFVLKDGKLYPPMVANPDGAATPVGVWLDADAAPIAGESKTGRPQVKQGGKGTQGGSGKLAYRPGWHLGVVPYAIQFNRKDAEGNKTLFPKNFVFAEVEYAADVDYQEEARQEGINPSGKYQHSLAGLKHLPTDGYYMYRTNPNPETDPWVITGAMKVNRILTRAEQAELVKNAGREPQQIQEGDIVTDDVVNSINQEIADAPKFSLKVYHGSGADFTEFDFDHMGEGAGSQVFGWGGYVTSSKKIGKSYAKIGQMSAEDRHRHASSEDTPIEAAVGSILGQEIYNERAKTFKQKKAQAIENAENSIASYSDMLKNSNELDEKSKKFLEKSIERYKKELEVLRALTEEQYKEEYIKQGRAKNLYEVDIPDDNGSNYLDWENPLNEEQRKAAENAYKYASELRPNKYAQYAIVDMSKPSKIPEYYEKKVLADNWRRFYNRAVHNELNDVRKKAWGNYKLFDLDRPFADQVNEVKGNVPDEFDAPDAATNKDNIKGLDRQVSSVAEPRYSLKDEKTLAGVHNITEEKLRKALKLGGFANPSLAVIDTNKSGHNNFGEISFIAPSALLDKRTGKTAGTWITDAYTQRYPSVEREMSEKGYRKFEDWVDSLDYPSGAKAEIERQAKDALSDNNAPAWELMYLKEKGIDIKAYDSNVDYRWKEIISDHPTAEDILNSMKTDPELNEKVTSLAKHVIIYPTWEKVSLEVRRKIYKETGVKKSPINPIVRQQTKEIFERDYKSTLLNKDGSPRKKDVKKVVEDIVKEHNDTKKYDFYLSKVKASNYVNKNGLYDDYIRWQEKKLDEFGTKNRIFRGYKPDGTRKYVPETLDNVSKVMREEADGQTNGSEYTSFGSFIAKVASRVDSTDEMRDNKDKLSSNEDKEKFYEKWKNVYYDLAKFLYNDVFYGEQRLHDIVLQSDPKKYAKKEYDITLTPTFMKKLDALKNAVQTELKSAYFETKYNRPLRLNEFAAAVVPDNLGEDVRKGIEDAGLPLYDYDPNKEGDRNRAFNEAINSSDNIRFSLKAMMEEPEGWKQANKKAIHIAEAIERDPKFSLKNLDGTLIKAGTYFSGGGLVEEGLKGIIDPVVAVEYDEKISGVYRNNFGQHIVTADVRDVDPKELVKQIDGEVEYFHASPVCKNYSQAKSNHAEVELDKETAASTAEFINAIKPKVVTIENVKGYKDSEAMKIITDALDANGYTWDADVYNAADYGGYTNRERLIVRAVRDGKLPAKPKKMAHKSGWYEAVADIIPTLTEKKNGVAPWMDVRLKADGIDWRTIDKPLYVMGSAYADGKIPHAFADELLPTLRTKSGDVIVMPDGKVYRAMGRVLARVSGVSDDYKMPFSENLSHTIIGNGIPTQLTEHVIAPLLTGSDPKFSIRTYHGTGASFDKFDFNHMGEGEGSQAFGWGGYVTNSKDIAEDYTRRAKIRKDNGGFEFVTDMSANNKDMVRQYIYKYKDVNKGLDAMRKDLPSALEMFPDDDDLKELSNILAKKNEEIAVPDNIAYLYDVDIPDDNGDYLDWDAPLTDKQKNTIIKELRRLKIDFDDFKKRGFSFDGSFGGNAYDFLMYALRRTKKWKDVDASRAVSKFLSSIGFTGIKYKAGTIFGGAKEGDYNYVIFDENNANIVGNTRFSLRYDQFEHDLNQWKKDNNLPKDAQRPSIPQRNAGESAVDFLRRVDEYRKQMALWKTAPTYEQHLLSDDTALGEFNRELQRGSVLKRIAFQDSMLAIRKAQEAIMKEVGVDRLNMAEDAYTAENRSHGKGKNEFEEYNNEFLQPLRKAYHQMKKVLGDSYDNVRLYMMAKHGLERNAQMAFKKSLEADYEDVAQRSAAYKAYKGDISRMGNDSGFELGLIDYATWVREDNAIKMKYSPSYMNYRYDKMGIAFDYSGLSALFDGSDFEEAAYKLVRDIEGKHIVETKELWDATNAATKKILRDGYKAGMMSEDTYQYVRDMYSHYIPLRGWDGTTADQVWDYIGGGKGAFNQTLKTANGRTSIADDPIAYIENMAESGILLNNKNWVKQHLMLLTQNHPTSLLTLSKAWYVKSTDANGNEEWTPATPQITSQMNSNQVKAAIDAFEQKMEQMEQTGDATQKRDGLNIAYPQTHSEEREHEVRVMKDGEEYVIYVNGDPQLAQAMNNTRAHRVREIQSGKLDRAAAWLGRKMAAAYTSLSPLFIPSNYFRDLTMTLASTAIREDGRYNYLLRKNLTTSWNLGFMLRDYKNGKLREKVNNGNATPKEQMFYDFLMNGGETGFVSSLDVDDLKKKFKNDLKDLNRWKANPVKVGHTIMDGIEFLNRAIEDSNRFAIYMTSIQYGRSIDEAVNDAKDVTLNFNRKGTGEYGWQMIRNLYLFINPAVQSLQTLGALVKHHPFKFTAVTASWLASGVLVPIVNAALMSLLGGDDDKDKYWQFTKWDRRNNLIMWVPFTHEYIKIPLAQEFRAFYGVGDMIASKMMGGELAEESWSQYAEDLLGQVVDMLPLDPTGYDGNIAVSLMPNPIRPVFELAFNVDFTGKPLFKETEYNKYDPNFTKAYVGTPDWLVRVSKMVNSIGNDYPDVQQNAIDAFGDPRYNLNNPAVVDHVLSSYLGGAYTMGSQVLGLLTKSLNDPKEIKMADIPLVSKFVSNPDDRPVTKKQGDEFWNMKENHDRAANTLSKLKKQAKVDGDYSMLERFYGSEEYKQYKQEDVKVKKYEEDKKKERVEESGEEYRPHKLNAEDIYKAHATPKDDFEDLKLKQLYTKLNGFKTSYDLLVDTAPGQSDGYYNTNKAAIDAIDEISLDKQEISELKKGFLEDGKDAYNAEDMKQIRELRKKVLAVLEKANKVVVANQKTKKK